MRSEFWHQLFVFVYFMKLTRRCHSYFASPMFFHKVQLVQENNKKAHRRCSALLLSLS